MDIYTITALVSPEVAKRVNARHAEHCKEAGRPYRELYSESFPDHRCFGFSPTSNMAEDWVEANSCDMHECLYDFIVIEEMSHGIHCECTQIQWYTWDHDVEEYSCLVPDKWVKIESPDWAKGICNWGLG